MLPIDKMIITQTFTMARWQIVVKTSEAAKPTKTKITTTTKKTSKQNKKQNNFFFFFFFFFFKVLV